MTMENKIGAYLNAYKDRYPLSGTVLVARDGAIVYEEAFGGANVEHGVPNSMNTRFGIWSVTKSFTAMSVLLLAEQGRLSLDDPAAEYIERFDRGEPITIRHLLQHRSGLPNFTSLASYNANWNKWPLTRDECLALLRDVPASFKPGESFAYNNTGYYLLGWIVERAAGESYDSFLRSRILEPLGMRDTGLNDGRHMIPGLASAYHSTGYELSPAEFIDMSSVFTAGGMYSTARDLLLWDQSFYSGTLLGREVMDPILLNEEAGYGLGWFLDRKHERRRVYHGGAYRGYRSELHRYPDDGVTVIVLSNYDFVPVTALAEQLAGIVFGQDASIPEPPPAYPLSEAEFGHLRGRYEGFGCQAIVDRDEDGYYFLWNKRERNPMYPISGTSFQHAWHDRAYAFKPSQEAGMTFLGMKKQSDENLG
ncbi:serine hydrolase domain-containing protein [Paenibacillus soyae]|uniref:Beta-lactamase family protein n=1 Tax=Paenibacillus soyae TaxID=2969249 RepID=A0A9X2S9N6_9BACL|nr:serine hydrolase domain-containing protein [Paenibacillus soyae]MCR2802927.1 beta-lactamase family protein [Paenibacillus soyae]